MGRCRSMCGILRMSKLSGKAVRRTLIDGDCVFLICTYVCN